MSRFSANPSQEHLDRALYIFKYLRGTMNYTLNYDGASNKGLIAYTDSDWASDVNKRRSTTGYFIKLATGSICWSSHLQKTIALSSTEAEYMAASDTTRQLAWIRSLMSELGFNISAIPLIADNQGSIFIGSNPAQDRRTKHIDIRYHFLKDAVQELKIVELFFIDGKDNPADLFTKSLGYIKFTKFRDQLGLTFKDVK